MRGQVPLQLIPVSRQVGIDRFSIGLKAWWKRRKREEEIPADEKTPTDGSNPARTKFAQKAYAGMTASELNWLQSLTEC
jgi:hypothetical protein